MQTGMFDRLIDITIRSYTGHIQIHKNGYWDDKDINNSMEISDSLMKVIISTNNVDKTVPRLEYFALASFGKQTKGALLTGTDPVKENALTNLSAKITKGRYLDSAGKGIVVAEGLASFLGLTVGDTLVLIGQGFHGVSAAGKYLVTGILHYPSPQLNNQLVYMNLPTAQDFFDAENRITSLSIILKNPDEINRAITDLKSRTTGQNFEIMRWDEIMVEIMQQLKAKTTTGILIIGILYMIVGFGIFGTVIMMTNERIKEFGVIVSVGMQKSRLAVITVLEMILLGLIGTLSGVMAAMPIIVYYHLHPIRIWGSMAQAFTSFGIEPIMPLALKPFFILWNVCFILFLVLLTCIYPIRKIFKLRVVDALHK
jgi:ABC-type lipoprotein release transport system permease subunit